MIKSLKEDKKGKTKAFFYKSKVIVFDKKFLNFIITTYKKDLKDLRICLHKKYKDKHQDMIILQQKKNFYMPHKHLEKSETYHIIKGKMGCVLFNQKGKIDFKCTLSENDIFRVPINTFHTMIPISKYVIYHENKAGAFKKNDSVHSNWTKKFKNEKDINKLRKIFIN